MGGGQADRATSPPGYSRLTGLIYIFNLIVGTGALTLPAAFHDAGYVLSSIILILLAFMSYLTATFVIESMAAANALLHQKRLQRLKKTGYDRSSIGSEALMTRKPETASILHSRDRQAPGSPIRRVTEDKNENHDMEQDLERRPLILSSDPSRQSLDSARNVYEITEITEMGNMAGLFFNSSGKNLFYLCLAIYLYGDLAIYGAAVAKSLRDVACSYRPENITSPLNISESSLCWAGSQRTRLDAYRIFLAIFVCTIGQFVFCNVTKTKYLQIVTTIMRWKAFIIMVALACMILVKTPSVNPSPALISGVPNLFGVCVYSFMCHHSLPSLVTPIADKRNLYPLIMADYFLILGFYFLLAFTGIFAFNDLNDLYTLNFQPSSEDSWLLYYLHMFLSLFPVFTLSTNFPIIAITLSNNLKSLFLTEGKMYSYWTRRLLFPLLALVPPTMVAMATHSLEFLVGITGSYAGAGIQYVVPAALVYYARQESGSALGVGVKNHHRSPFSSKYWVWFVQAWAVTCVVFVTWNHVLGAVEA